MKNVGWRLVPGAAIAAAVMVVALGAPDSTPQSGNLPQIARLASSATASTSTSGGSSTPSSPPNLPPAPATFPGQIDNLYTQIYGVQQTLQSKGTPELPPVTGSSGSGSTSSSGSAGSSGSSAPNQIPTSTQFATMVAQLTGPQLAQLYSATQHVSGWSTLPGQYQTLQSDAASYPASPQSPTSSSSLAPARIAHSATGTFPPTAPTGSFPAPPQPYQPTSPIGAANIPTTCPAPAPGADGGAAAIFAAQVATSVTVMLATALAGNIGVIVDGVTTEFPDPAGIIAEVLADASQIVLDSFNYYESANADCANVQTVGLAANIDNTTVNIYDLSTELESTIANIANSVNTISGQVSTVQQTVNQEITLAVEQALATPESTVPNIAFELPASLGGNLNSTPVGVQSVVSSAVTQLKAAGSPVNPAATVDLAAANSDLAAGNYSAAYSMYHQAYLQAVQ